MDIVSRAKNIITTPNTEWPVIAAEPADTGPLFTGYVVPMAAIGLVATIIGSALAGNIAGGLALGIVSFVLSLIGVFIDGLVFSKVAPMFGGRDDMGQGLKLAAYSNTPGWLIAVINVLVYVAPVLGILGLVALYGFYLLYTGAVPVMGVPKDRAVGFTVVAIIIAIVIYVVLSLLVGGIVLAAFLRH